MMARNILLIVVMIALAILAWRFLRGMIVSFVILGIIVLAVYLVITLRK